jgi:predicted CXXCH cytochrome family protein
MFATPIDHPMMRHGGHLWTFVLMLVLAGVLAGTPARGHVDSPMLTDECGSCHVGHGQSGEPMLAKSEEDFCFQCHGSEDERARMVHEGRLQPSSRLKDIRQDFEKMFSHPVSISGVHTPDENMSSIKSSNTDHAECVDCHNPHQKINGMERLNYQVSGYSLSGQFLEESVYEYEICLKCHFEQLGGKRGGESLRRAFALNVRSQHPVTVTSANKSLPSLRSKAWSGDRMLCSDCHRSDDPDGPRGPHGSIHEFLLSGNYNRDVYVQESPYEYEFCYSCHDRSSILSNESFTQHRDHIEGDPLTGRSGTSCFTCHASHGSPDNPWLIRFNPQAVAKEKSGLGIEYIKTGSGTGTCVLECHGHNHSQGGFR